MPRLFTLAVLTLILGAMASTAFATDLRREVRMASLSQAPSALLQSGPAADQRPPDPQWVMQSFAVPHERREAFLAEIAALAQTWLAAEMIEQLPAVDGDVLRVHTRPAFAGSAADAIAHVMRRYDWGAPAAPARPAGPAALALPPTPAKDLQAQAGSASAFYNITDDVIAGSTDSNATVQIRVNAANGATKVLSTTTSNGEGHFILHFSPIDLIGTDRVAITVNGVTTNGTVAPVASSLNTAMGTLTGRTTAGRAVTVFLHQYDQWTSYGLNADANGVFSVTASQLGVDSIRSSSYLLVYISDLANGQLITQEWIWPTHISITRYGSVAGVAPPSTALTIRHRAANGTLLEIRTATAARTNGWFSTSLINDPQVNESIEVTGAGYSRQVAYFPITGRGIHATNSVVGAAIPNKLIRGTSGTATRTMLSTSSGSFTLAFPTIDAETWVSLLHEESDGDVVYGEFTTPRITVHTRQAGGDSVYVSTAYQGSGVVRIYNASNVLLETLSGQFTAYGRAFAPSARLGVGYRIEVVTDETASVTVPAIAINITRASRQVNVTTTPNTLIDLNVWRSWVQYDSSYDQLTTAGSGVASRVLSFDPGPGTVARAYVRVPTKQHQVVADQQVAYFRTSGTWIEWCQPQAASQVLLVDSSGAVKSSSVPRTDELGCGWQSLGAVADPGDRIRVVFPSGTTTVPLPDPRLHINKYTNTINGISFPNTPIRIAVYDSTYVNPPIDLLATADATGGYRVTPQYNIKGQDDVFVRYQGAADVLYDLYQETPYLRVTPTPTSTWASGTRIQGTSFVVTLRAASGAIKAQHTVAATMGDYAYVSFADANGVLVPAVPGDTIVYTNDTVQETIVVPNTVINPIDHQTDTVSGSGPASATYAVEVVQGCSGCTAMSAEQRIQASGTGAWMASFAGTFNIQRGHRVSVDFITPEASFVAYTQHAPSQIHAELTRDYVWGYTIPHRTATITLRDAAGSVRAETPVTTDYAGYFSVTFGSSANPLDIVAGNSVTVNVPVTGSSVDISTLQVAPVVITANVNQGGIGVTTTPGRAFNWSVTGEWYTSGWGVAGSNGSSTIATTPLRFGDMIALDVDSGDTSGSSTNADTTLPALITVDETLNTVDLYGPINTDATLRLYRSGVLLGQQAVRLNRWNNLGTPITFTANGQAIDILPYDRIEATVGSVTVDMLVASLSLSIEPALDRITGTTASGVDVQGSVYLWTPQGYGSGLYLQSRTDTAGNYVAYVPAGNDLRIGDYGTTAVRDPNRHRTRVWGWTTNPSLTAQLPATMMTPGTLPVGWQLGDGLHGYGAELYWDTISHASDYAYANSAAVSPYLSPPSGTIVVPERSGPLYVRVRMWIDGRRLWSAEHAVQLTRAPTATSTPTNTPSNTPTWTPSNTPSNTPTNTNTPTWTPSNTPTWTPSNTPTWTPSNTPTNTNTPTWTPSNTPTNTNTPTWTPTHTNTPTWTPTSTPVPRSDTYLPIVSNPERPNPYPTPTPTNTPTNTPTWTPTNTPTRTPTATPTPNLKSRVTDMVITLPQPLAAVSSNWCTWAGCNLSPRLYQEPRSDGRTLVGWTDASGTGHVSIISQNGVLEQTFNYPSLSVRGLVAHDDGAFAVMQWDAAAKIMWLSKRNASGGEIWRTNIDGSLTSFAAGIGDSRLSYGNNQYGAYFAVYGDSGWPAGHNGDQLTYIDSNGVIKPDSGGWEWGCSHSMAALLSYHPTYAKFAPVCSSDCYRAKGIVMNNNENLVVYPSDGNCGGLVSAQLGQVAVASDSWKLIFNALNRPGFPGRGIGWATLDSSFQSSHIWLTNTDGTTERDPVGARIGTNLASDRYLVGWKTTNDNVYRLAVITGNGTMRVLPEEVSSAGISWGNRDDSFRTRADGQISWIQGNAGSRTLHLFRFNGATLQP